MASQFRCAFFTDRFETTVDFYETSLGFKVAETWDRAPDDKGAIFLAGTGMIEVLATPHHDEAWVWDKRKPQGFAIVIELDDVDAFYNKLREKHLSIAAEIADMPWGHRSFRITDPNGVALYFYSEISK